MANIQSIITYNANLSPAQAQIKALTGQVAGLTAAFNTLDKSALKAQSSLASTFMANVGQIGGFRSEIVKVNSGVEQFGKNLAAQRLTMRQYFREAIAGYTKQNSLMKQLAMQQVAYQQAMAVPLGGGRAAIITPTNMSALANSAAMASAKFSIFNELIQGASTRLLNFGKNTQWTGRQLMVGFTVPMAMFTVLLSKQFRDMDKELTRFQKVYGADLGNTVKSTTLEMRKQVEELAYSISRTYGVAAKETAALAADIAATGREGEELIASIQQTTRLAVLGEVDRQEAMKATLSLQSAFKQNTDELAESINFLNAVENQTSATLEDLATAIPKVGPVIQSLGGSVEDLAVLLVAMREGGVPAAEAANALKSGLASLINPTAKAADVAKKFGVNLVGIVEANRGQLMPTITALQDALQGLDDFSRARIIEEIFGKFQFARISALFANLGKAGSQTTAVLDLASKSSVELAKIANDELRTLQESTSMRFQRTLENLRSSLIPLGEILTESIIPIFQFIGSGIGKFVEFFQALPEPVKNFAKYGLLITALAGPVVMLVGLFGNLIANGIKFSMAIVRIGAKMAGLRFEKFELLDATAAAARMNIDNLTTSFTTQERALNRLQGVLATYVSSLRTLSQTNPALFVPGALGPRPAPVPAARNVPLRRQSGSTRPEFVPGTGRGDKIPALLEPGEFVVNRSATEKYAPILSAMNTGKIQGLQDGSVGLRGGPVTYYSPYTIFAPGNNPSGFGMSRQFFESSEMFERSIRASAMAAVSIEKNVNLTSRTMSQLSQAISPTTQQVVDALRLTATEMVDAGQDVTHISQVLEQARPRVQAIISQISDPEIATAMQKLLYPTTQQVVSGGYRRVAGVTVDPATGLTTRRSRYTEFAAGSDASRFAGSRLKTAAQYLGVPTSGSFSKAHLDLTRISGPVMPFTGGALGADPRIRLAAQAALEQHIRTLVTEANNGALAGIQVGVSQGLDNNSPSNTARNMLMDDGKDLAMGALLGLQQGFQQTPKRIVAPPLPSGGLESISPYQRREMAVEREISARKLLEKALIKETQQIGLIADTQQRMDALSKRHNVNLQNWNKDIETGIWVHKDGTRAGKLRTAALEKLAAEERILTAQQQKLSAIVVIRERAELNASVAADMKTLADNNAASAIKTRAFKEEMTFTPGPAGFVSGVSIGGGAAGVGVPATRNTITMPSFTGTPSTPTMTISGPGTKPASRETIGFNRGSSTITGQGFKPVNTKTPISSAMESAKDIAADQDRGPRGTGFMNMAFLASMAVSSLSMLGGVSQDVASKLGIFSTALIGATMVMQMTSGKGLATNFLGLGKLGQMATSRGMTGLGSTLAMLGGPKGMLIAGGITAITTGIILYNRAAAEARERTMAAFKEPAKTVEYFGKTLVDTEQKIKDLQKGIEGLEEIEDPLREAVREDYAILIEKIRYGGAEAGARELTLAFNKMLVSGLSAEEAKAAVTVIAAEAGAVGGEAFSKAMAQGMMSAKDTEDIVAQTEKLYSPETLRSNVGLLETAYNQFNRGGMSNIDASISMAMDNIIGDIASWGFSLLSGFTGNFRMPGEFREDTREKAEYARTVNQMYNNIRENMDITSAQAVEISKLFFETFEDAPKATIEAFREIKKTAIDLGAIEFDPAAIQEFIAAMDPLAAITLGPLIKDNEQLGLTILEATQAGISLQRIIEIITSLPPDQWIGAIEAEVDLKVNVQEAQNALNDLQQKFQDDAVIEIDADISAAQSEITRLERSLREWERIGRRRRKRAIENYEGAVEGIENTIKALEDEKEAISDLIEAEREKSQEKIENYEEEKEQINDSTDAYLKSIQKRQRADNFYANQRKTALGGLKALAEGDVFGFLEARQEMSAAAQDFAFENEIEKIEAVRDAENERIDNLIEREQKRQEEFEKAQQKRLDAIDDEIDKQNELRDVLDESHQAELDRIDRRIKRRQNEIEDEIRGKQRTISELRSVREAILAGETVSAEKLAKVLGEPWVRRQEQIIKAAYLAKLAEPGITQEEAAMAVAPLYQILKGLDERQYPTSQEMLDWLRGIPYESPTAPPVPGGDTRNAAAGGYISGPGSPTSDSIPARLSNGEYVVKASSVKKYGVPLMNAINEARFAKGGYVGFANGGQVPNNFGFGSGYGYKAPPPAPTPAPNNYGFGSGYGYRAPAPAPAPNNYGYGSGYGGYSPTTNRTSNTTNNTAAPAVKMVYHPMLGYVPEAVASSYSSQRTTSYKSYYNNNNFGFGWGYGSGATKETPNNFGFSNNTPIVNNFGFGIGFGSKELPVDTFGFKNSYGPSRFTMVDHPVLGKVPAIVAAQYNNSVNNPGPSFTDIFRSVDPFRQGQERRDEEKAIRDERDRLVSLMAQYDVATTEEKYRMNINYPDLNRRINELNDQLGEGGTVGSFLGDMWQATREDFAAYLSVQPQVALAVALTGQKETADKALSSIAGLSEEEWTQRSGWENVVGALMFGSNFIPIPGFAAIKAAVTAGRAGIKTAASSGLRQGVKSIIPAYQTAKQAAAKGVASTMLGIDVATGGLGRSVDNLRGGAVKSSTPSKVISAEDVTRSNIQEQINAVRETFRASRTMPKQPRPIDDATLARSVSEHISQKDWDDLLQFSNENGMSWDDIVSTIKTNPEKLTEDGSAVLTLIRNFYEHRASLVKQAQENSPKYQELSALNQAKAKEFRRSFNERWKELYGDSTPFELPEPTDISLSLYDDLLSTMSREEAMGKLAIVMSEVFGGDMSKLVPILKKSTDRASSQYKKYGYDNSPATFSSFSELMQSAAPEKIFQYHYGVDPLLLLDEMAYRKTLLNTKMDASGATAHIESTRAVMYNLDSTYKNLAEESSLIAARTIYPGINWTLDTPIQVTKGWSGFMPIPDGDFRHVANLKRSDRVALHEGAHPEAAGVGGWSRQAKLKFGSPEQFSPFAEAGWTAPGRLKWGGTPADTSRPITLTQRLHDSHTTDEFVLDLLDNEVAKSFSSTGLNIIPALGHAYSWMNPRTAGYWSYNPQNAFLGMYADPNFGLMGYSSKTLGLGDAAMNSAQGSVQLRKTFGTLGLGPEQELLIPPSFIDNLLNVKGPTKNLNTEDLLEKRGTIHREVMQTSAYTNSGARRFKYSPTPQTISQQEYDRFMRMLDEYVQYGDKFGGPRFTKEQLLEAINIEKNSSGRYTVSGNVHYLNYLGKDLLDRISTLHEAKEFISQEFYGRGIISAETAQQVAQEVNEDFWRSRIASLKAQSGMPFNPDDLSSRELMNLISSQEMEIFSKALADPYSLGNYSSESIRDAVGVIESMLGKQLYVDTSFSSNYRLWKSGLYAPKDENELQAFIALSAAEGVTIPSWPGVGSFEMPQKYAEGGLVESMKKWFPNGNHNFYPGWSKWTSWDKGKPQLVTMHHTALPDGVSQRQELDSIAKNWKGKPVVQAWLGKSGEAWTLAAGDTGYGHGIGTTKYMKGDLEQAKEIIDIAGHPNRVSWQMEVSSAGKVKDFTSSQFDSIARMTAAIREWAGWPTFQGRIIQHKDWAGYRTDGTARVDTLYPTSVFTQNAEKVWREGGGSSDTGAGTGGGDSSDNPSGDSITGRTIPSSAIGRIGFRALPRFITGAMLPSVQKPPPSDSGGAGDGEPIFDENRLKNLGYSLATAKKTLAHVEAGNWPRQWHRLAWTIAMRESGGDVSKIYQNRDYGLFQLNKEIFGNREWWDNNKVLQGDYNSSMSFKHVSDNADTFLPWAMMKSYDGTSAGFNWSLYDGRPWYADATEKRTNDLWPTFLGYRETSDDSGGGGGDGSDSSGSNAGQKAVDYSRTQLGKPYSFSANPPNSWDCSTLTAWAWAVATGGSPQLGWKDNNAAVKLTPYSHTQANQLRKRTIGLQSGQIQGLAPGDILYFRTEKSNEQASGGHTSIYAGSGQVIQASTPSTGVIISSLNSGWNTGINNQTGQPRFQWAGPPIGYAAGGFVSGPGTPTSDSIPAVLSNGEYVVRASSVKKYGKGMMDAINSGQISPQMFGMGGSVKKYAVGGLVGSMPQSLSYNMPTPQEATPSFNMPSMAPAFAGGGEVTNMSSIGGSTSSNNSSSVKIVINGVRGKDTKTLAKQVAQMIRNSDNRRDHSRSIG